jgi:hypothetical protein
VLEDYQSNIRKVPQKPVNNTTVAASDLQRGNSFFSENWIYEVPHELEIFIFIKAAMLCHSLHETWRKVSVEDTIVAVLPIAPLFLYPVHEHDASRCLRTQSTIKPERYTLSLQCMRHYPLIWGDPETFPFFVNPSPKGDNIGQRKGYGGVGVTSVIV